MTTNTTRIASIIAPGLALLVLSACATAKADDDVLDGYTLTGETRRCLPSDRIRSVTALGETAVIFRLGANDLYINRVGPGCKGAADPFRRLQYDVRGGSLCTNETLRVVANGDNLTAGFCRLDVFEQVTAR